MAKEKEMTLGELIESEKFKTELETQIKKAFKEYDTAADKFDKVKRNPMMRLREMSAEEPKKMIELYIGIIDHNSDLPATLREYVTKICEPVLNKCLVSLYKEMKAKEKEGEDGNEA
jgi:hypothetical protein